MADCDSDRGIYGMSHSEIKQATAAPRVTALKRSLQNNGVDIMGRSAFLVSGVHTEQQIDRTLESFERCPRRDAHRGRHLASRDIPSPLRGKVTENPFPFRGKVRMGVNT